MYGGLTQPDVRWWADWLGAGAEVLVLGAGVPDEQREIHIPAAYPMLFKSPLDWDYDTEPQKFLNSRTDYWLWGKMLGGSSSINAQVYQQHLGFG